ncbi:MAG: metal-dependent hydrolase [Candidatus Nanohaloarchaea archaeon]
MIIGHGLLAFTAVALLSHLYGLEDRRAVAAGLVAGGFAALPDVDIIYAWKEVAVVFGTGPEHFMRSFWEASEGVHRGITHSLLTGFFAAGTFSAYYRLRDPVAETAVLSAGVGYGILTSGPVAGFVMGVFLFSGLALTRLSERYVSWHDFIPAVFIGLLSHSFGDLFTGVPPDFLFPLKIQLFSSRIQLMADPVLNLLAVFFMEALVSASALATFASLKGHGPDIRPEFLVGLLYASAIPFVPPPTLGSPFGFVFTVLGCGLAAIVLITLRDRELEMSTERLVMLAWNGTLAVLTGFFVYLGGYLV